MNTTKRIEKTIEALDKKQLKNALFLTDRPETERHHQWVKEAAQTCLTNKGDKERCDAAIKEAKAKIVETVTVALEDTSLEGIEEMLEERADERDSQLDQETEEVVAEKSDEELYEECPDCHLAVAAAEFVKIAEKDECDGVKVMGKLQPCLDNQETAPETWLKTMTEVTEQATCKKSEYGQVLGELTEYLESKGGIFLNYEGKKTGIGL